MKTNAGLLVGLGLAVSLGGGCATTRTLAVSTASQPLATYEQGTPCLQSVKTNTVTLWLLTPEFRGDLRDLRPPAFRVLVRNGGGADFAFSPADVAASSGGTAVQVLTIGEYVREIDRQADAMEHMANLGAAEAAEKADQTAAYASTATAGTTGGANNTQLNDFSTLPHGTVSDAREQIDTAAKNRRAEIDAWRKDRRADADLMLGRLTVAPGAMAGGVIRLDPAAVRPGESLKLVITTGGEPHEFVFEVGR